MIAFAKDFFVGKCRAIVSLASPVPEEKKEMKVKKLSPAMYRAGEKAEGVHGKSGMMKPSKYARGGKVRYGVVYCGGIWYAFFIVGK